MTKFYWKIFCVVLYTNGLLPALRLSCLNSLLARPTRTLLVFTSLALPDDSVSFNPEPLLVSSRFNLDLKPVVLEPEELAESHGLVRIRDRSRGDWIVGDNKGGGIEEGGTIKLLLEDSAEIDSVRRWYFSCSNALCCNDLSSSRKWSLIYLCKTNRIISLCEMWIFF